MSSDTGPAASELKKLREAVEEEMDARLRTEYPSKHSERNHHQADDERATPHSRVTEPSFAQFYQWLSGIAAVLISLGVGWIASLSVSTASDVKVLLARPEPVPMAQYKSDQEQLQRQLDELKSQLKLKP